MDRCKKEEFWRRRWEDTIHEKKKITFFIIIFLIIRAPQLKLHFKSIKNKIFNFYEQL